MADWVKAATLTGHSDYVTAVAVLPDGRLASGSRDMSVKLWDTATAACTATLTGHSNSVYALAVLPDGRLASGSGDNSVKLWDMATATCTATLTGHSNTVYALAVLPDGRLASGSADKSVKLWDTVTAACTATLTGHSGYVCALAVLPDGRLASGSRDNSVKLWDTAIATCAATLNEEAYAGSFALLSDGRLAVGGSPVYGGANNVFIWRSAQLALKSTELKRVEEHKIAEDLRRRQDEVRKAQENAKLQAAVQAQLESALARISDRFVEIDRARQAADNRAELLQERLAHAEALIARLAAPPPISIDEQIKAALVPALSAVSQRVDAGVAEAKQLAAASNASITALERRLDQAVTDSTRRAAALDESNHALQASVAASAEQIVALEQQVVAVRASTSETTSRIASQDATITQAKDQARQAEVAIGLVSRQLMDVQVDVKVQITALQAQLLQQPRPIAPPALPEATADVLRRIQACEAAIAQLQEHVTTLRKASESDEHKSAAHALRLEMKALTACRAGDYSVLRLKGWGTFGAVLIAACAKPDHPAPAGRLYALKAIFPGAARSSAVRNLILNETEILSTLPPHRNIVRYFHQFSDRVPEAWLPALGEDVVPLVRARTSVGTSAKLATVKIIVLECHDETLLHRISEGNGEPPVAADALRWALDIAAGLAHLEANHIVHRDMKLENILLASDGRAVIADFGSSLQLPVDSFEVTTTIVDIENGGNELHLAPEVLQVRRKVHSDRAAAVANYAGQYVFELGVLLYDLAVTVHPIDGYPDALWDTVTKTCVYHDEHIADYPESFLGPEMAAIAKACVRHNPAARPSLQDVIAALERALA